MTRFQHSAAIFSRFGSISARSGHAVRHGHGEARIRRRRPDLMLRRLLMVCLLTLFQAVPALAEENAPAPVVNINTASAEALAEGLERIGPVRAQAIVAWREKNGKFTNAEQLSAVPGVGAAVVELNRGRITVQ